MTLVTVLAKLAVLVTLFVVQQFPIFTYKFVTSKVISTAKEKKQKEWANDLNDSECQNE